MGDIVHEILSQGRMRTIGVMTSGGDCPGMNAAIRAVVRTGIYHGLEVIGIRRGFAGLIDGDVEKLEATSVSGIINKGGTILRTARCSEFRTKKGQKKAWREIEKAGLEGLIVVGGDGSFRGAWCLEKAGKTRVVGVPASIDNDLAGTDMSIGFDSAVNTAVQAIDKIRDTAASHERLFIVEVMGRNSGFIALQTGLAGGAEDILMPEIETDLEKTCEMLKKGRLRGKLSSIIVVAEGDECGGAFRIAEEVRARTGYEVRVTVLGHLQRGGAPTAFDRVLGSRLGSMAMELLIKGKHGKMVGISGSKTVTSTIGRAWKHRKKIPMDMYKLALKLAT